MQHLSKETKWSLAGFLMLVCIIIGMFLYMRVTGHDAETMVEQIGEAGLLMFMIAMVVLPLAGFPVTPFYVIGGAAFGNVEFVLALTLTQSFNLAIAYLLGRWVLAPLFSKPKWDLGRKRHCWAYVLLIRIGPGTINMKDYLLGALRAPFGKYMAISWPLCMGYAVGFIIFGDAAVERNLPGVVTGIVLVGLFSITVYLLRRRFRMFS